MQNIENNTLTNSFWRCATAVTKRKPVIHSFHSRINGHLNCLPLALCKLCNLDPELDVKSSILQMML